MAASNWSYPLIASGVLNVVEGDILMLKEAAASADRHNAVRLAYVAPLMLRFTTLTLDLLSGFGGLQVAKGALALYASRPSASEESKKIATAVVVVR